jgi:integrase
MRKPFFRKARKCWYIKDEQGHFIRLDPDERKAFAIWERLRNIADYKHHDASLEAIFEAFLKHHEPEMSKVRFTDLTWILEEFAIWFGATRLAREVGKGDVTKWMRSERDLRGSKGVWSAARQRDAGHAVKRALDWAMRRGYLPWSDVAELRLPSPDPRDGMISYADHCRLIAGCQARKSRPFRLVLIALRLSGARPAQVRELTAQNVVGDSWVFRRHKTSSKTGKPLVVRCGPCLQTLTRILMHARPMGPMLLSSHRKPWPKDGIVLRFRRLRESVGLTDVTAYSYRHTYATDALQAGVSLPTVAALLGHVNPTMVSRVYGHLEKRSDHLSDAVAKIKRAE